MVKEVKNMVWTESDEAYAKMMVEVNDDRWYKFAGQAMMAGITLKLPVDVIMEYILESFHGMDIATEVPLTYEGVLADMKLI